MIESVQIGVNSPLGSAPYQDPNLSQPSTGGGALPVDTNDTLRLDLYTLVDSGPYRLNAIVRTWHGNHYEYIPYQRDFVAPNIDGTLNRFEIPLTRGELISVMVQSLSAVASPVQYGDVFIRLAVIRGQTSDALRYPTAILMQDYITTLGFGAWPGPGARIISAPENPGASVNINATPAGANTEVAFAVPVNTLLIVHSIFARFTAGAAAANRSFAIFFNDAAANRVRTYESEVTLGLAIANSVNRFYLQPGGNAISDTTAATRRTMGSLMTHQSNVAAQNIFQADFQPFDLVGFRVATLTTNMQAADQWLEFRMVCERWTFPNTITP